tara:strand:- start:1185 stop:2135 length:951 start_codon:yes stop_codon:yes gene_type:complete
MDEAALNPRIEVQDGVAQLSESGEFGVPIDDEARSRLISARGVSSRDLGSASEADVRAFLREHGKGAKVPEEVPEAPKTDPEVAFGGPPLASEPAPVEEATVLASPALVLPPALATAALNASPLDNTPLRIEFTVKGPAKARFLALMNEIAFSEEVILHDIDVTPGWTARYVLMKALQSRSAPAPQPPPAAQPTPQGAAPAPPTAPAPIALKTFDPPPTSLFFSHPSGERVPSAHQPIHAFYTARGFSRYFHYVGAKPAYSYWTPDEGDQGGPMFTAADSEGRPAVRRLKLRTANGDFGHHDVVMLGQYPSKGRRA